MKTDILWYECRSVLKIVEEKVNNDAMQTSLMLYDDCHLQDGVASSCGNSTHVLVSNHLYVPTAPP